MRGSPSLPLGNADDLTHSDLFLVRVSEVLGSSPPKYRFVERWVNASGVPVDWPSGRANQTTDPAYSADEAVTFEVDDLALCRRSPRDGTKWELVKVAGSGGTGGGSPCSAPGWLLDFPFTSCLDLTVLSGSGRCGCINTNQEFTLVYNPAASGWIGVAPFATCCGCSRIKFDIDTTTFPYASLVLTSVNDSCVDGSPYSYTLKFMCGGKDPVTGRGFAVFAGAGTANCSGDEAACDNSFLVMVECSPCPPAVCGCPGCGAEGGAAAFMLDPSGFSGNCAVYNGGWVLTFVDECLYSMVCDGITITLDYDEGDDEWTLTFAGGGGGATYTVAGASFDCCGTSALTLDADTCDGQPATVAVTSLSPNDECAECCGGCDWERLKALGTLYVTFDAGGVFLDGLTVPVVWNEANDRFESAALGGPLCDCVGEYRFALECDGGSLAFVTIECGPTITVTAVVDVDCGPPFVFEAEADIEDCEDGPVSGGVVVSEVAP